MLSTCHVPAAAARTRKAVETATAHRDHQLGCSWFSRRAMKVRSVQVPHSQHALHQSLPTARYLAFYSSCDQRLNCGHRMSTTLQWTCFI